MLLGNYANIIIFIRVEQKGNTEVSSRRLQPSKATLQNEGNQQDEIGKGGTTQGTRTRTRTR